MAEVPDHLVPGDGLTSSAIRFDAMEVAHNRRGAVFKFGIYGEDKNWIANFDVFVETPPNGGVQQMIAGAHRQMSDVLRQWLYMTDVLRQSYETQSPDPSQATTPR